jgi:hypothetical protein
MRLRGGFRPGQLASPLAPPGIICRLLEQEVDAMEKFFIEKAIAANVAAICRSVGYDHHVMAQVQQERSHDVPAVTNSTFVAANR